MSTDPFAPLTKKKFFGYVSLAAAILLIGGGMLLYVGMPLWRVLLAVLVFGMLFLIVVAAVNWVSGGKRIDKAVGPDGVRPPVRLVRAMPYIFAALIIIQIVRWLESLASK